MAAGINMHRVPNWQDWALPLILLTTGSIVLYSALVGIVSLDRIQNLWPLAVALTITAGIIPNEKERD